MLEFPATLENLFLEECTLVWDNLSLPKDLKYFEVINCALPNILQLQSINLKYLHLKGDKSVPRIKLKLPLTIECMTLSLPHIPIDTENYSKEVLERSSFFQPESKYVIQLRGIYD